MCTGDCKQLCVQASSMQAVHSLSPVHTYPAWSSATAIYLNALALAAAVLDGVAMTIGPAAMVQFCLRQRNHRLRPCQLPPPVLLQPCNALTVLTGQCQGPGRLLPGLTWVAFAGVSILPSCCNSQAVGLVNIGMAPETYGFWILFNDFSLVMLSFLPGSSFWALCWAFQG